LSIGLNHGTLLNYKIKTMKHVKLFEAFVNESDPKVKAMRKKLNSELEGVYAEMEDIQARKDEIEAAVDAGQLDNDEAGGMWSRLDSFWIDLEEKRDGIKAKLSQLKGK